MNLDHEFFMREAIEEAKKAEKLGEVPIGAVIVKDGEIISRAYNMREILKDSTAHAEILAIKEAGKSLGGWRLNGCILYVTLEPCQMCSGALIQARLDHVVFATKDPKAGCVGSVCNLLEYEQFNHQVKVTEGILKDEASKLLKVFFQQLRERKKIQ